MNVTYDQGWWYNRGARSSGLLTSVETAQGKTPYWADYTKVTFGTTDNRWIKKSCESWLYDGTTTC